MRLWLRSQDKTLFEEVHALKYGYVEETHYCFEPKNNMGKNYPHCIIVNNDYIFGEYKTKERAISVLDEIQNVINAKTIIKFKNFIPQDRIKQIRDTLYENSIVVLDDAEIKELAGVIVYQMPKE